MIFSLNVRSETLLEHGTSKNFQIKKYQKENQFQIIIEDLKGQKLSVEKITMLGEQFAHYEWKQYQTNDEVQISLEDKKLSFKSEDDKKTLKLSKSELSRTVLPPLLTDYLRRRIKAEPKIKEFEVKVIIPDKMMLLDFHFKKKKDFQWILEPDSFFVGLVVSTVTFEFDENDKLKTISDIMLPIKPTAKADIKF